MSARERAVNRRRATARRLRDEGRSIRQIAAELDVGKSTVERDLAERPPVPNLQDSNGRPIAGAEPNNRRAERHGAYSPTRVEPRAAELTTALAAVLPYLAEPSFERATAAWSRAEARVELLADYLDVNGNLDEEGKPRPALDALLRWEKLATDHRGRLGLDPRSRAQLEREAADAARGRFDLDELIAEGRKALAERGLST